MEDAERKNEEIRDKREKKILERKMKDEIERQEALRRAYEKNEENRIKAIVAE